MPHVSSVRVRAALRRQPRTAKLRTSVSAAGGVVRLAGVVQPPAEPDDAVHVAAAVPGVREVESEPRPAAPARTLHIDG